MFQMKRIFGLKKCFLIFLMTLFWVSAAYAQGKSSVILVGPDVVQIGDSVTYSVSTEGGIDSSYTWEWGYRTNNSATIEDGVLTALNPGVIGINVYGNDTGASASLHVQVVTNKSSSLIITGPDKVTIGNPAAFSASTGAASDGNCTWFVQYSSPPQVARINVDNGMLTGIGEGTVIIGATDSNTGLSGEKTVTVVTSETQAPMVSIAAGLGEGLTLQLVLSIRGDIPENASLYIAAKMNGSLYYLPSGSLSPTPFRTNPKETSFETVLSVPVSSIPYQEYTFYAALLKNSSELVSNLDTAVVSAGKK